MTILNLKIKKFEDEEQIEKLRALEKEIGVVIVAFKPELRPATLSEEQIERLRAAERELSAVLVAFDKS